MQDIIVLSHLILFQIYPCTVYGIFLSIKDIQDYIEPPPEGIIISTNTSLVSVSPRKYEICVLSGSKDSLNHENPAY